MDYVREAVVEHWGERCSDFEPECFCCKAWAQYDQLVQAENDLYDLAARYDQLLEHLNSVMKSVVSPTE